MAHDELTDSQPARPGNGQRRIVALAADMIFASKIRGSAHAVNREVTLARNAQQLVELIIGAAENDHVTAIVDLDTRGLNIDKTITDIRHAKPDVEIIAYVSHVNTDAIHEARGAGADKVLARSAFTQQLTEILRNA